MEMPPLPSPSWRETRPTNPPKMMAEWFGVEKMREYGELCARMAREEAAEIVEARAEWDACHCGCEGQRSPRAQKDVALIRAAAAIRMG